MGITFRELNQMMVFGLDSENNFVHIDEVKNGYECNCFCPNCHNRLNAKNNGEKKEHHFAHANGSDCKKGHENTLQLLLKRTLEKNRKILLPQGNVKIGKSFVNDYREVDVKNAVVVRNQIEPVYVSFETPEGESIAIYIVITNDEMFERRLICRDNLIEIDLRSYKDSELPVEETILKVITEKTYKKQWVKRSDEKAIISKMLNVSSWKSFGRDVEGMIHIYCPKIKKTVIAKDVRCYDCDYYSKNIVISSDINGCIGFIEEPLSVDAIMKSEKPDYTCVDGPSYLEMHGEKRGRYYSFVLSDLPLAYPEKNYTLIYNEIKNAVFFVSLKAIQNHKYVGIEIDVDGSEIGVDFNIDKIYFQARPWSVCSIKEFKITQEIIDRLEDYLNK